MGDEPEVVNRVPEEAPEPVKPSQQLMRLLKALLIVEVMGKWQVLKNLVASFGNHRFKIEQSFYMNDLQLFFMAQDGKLQRGTGAKTVFMAWEKQNPAEFDKFATELMKREKKLVDPQKYEQGDYKRLERVRAAMGEPEKRWLDTRLTPFEQFAFYKKQELWKDPS